MLGGPARGVLLAIVAYTAWGFLSPVGSILLDDVGPFTLNAIRTILAIPLFIMLFGPRISRDAFRSVTQDAAVWIVGAGWLTLTFVPYLWSLQYLEPTVTTLTVYLAPLLVAAWQTFRFHEPVSRLLVPTVLATLGGAYLVTSGSTGWSWNQSTAIGLSLALLGVVGWSAYTIHLKVLTRTRDANTLTLAAFITSGVAFCVGALAVEHERIPWNRELAWWLALYVLLPTVLSFWLYTLSLRHADATTIAVLLGIELVSTAIVSHFVTHETFTATKIAGLIVVILAVTAYLVDERRLARRSVATTT